MSDPALPAVPPPPTSTPDYIGIVKFLVQPFLESPDSLKVDCEILPRKSRVLIRIAFEGEDKGRVFGRGGRNIQAIRSVLLAVAQAAGYTAYLDIYGSQTGGGSQAGGREYEAPEKPASPKAQPRRHSRPRNG